MKFIKPLKRDNKLLYSRPKSSLYAQKSGNEIFLRKLITKKRGIKGPKPFLRKYLKLFKISFIAGILFGFCAIQIRFLSQSKFLKITNVEVLGASKFVNEGDVKKLAESNVIGKSLFLYNVDPLSKDLSKNFLGAKSIVVEKKYPHTIQVIAEERKPLAVLIKDAQDKKGYLIDSEGYVLGTVDDSFGSLPRIIYDGNINVGQFVEKEIIPLSAEILKDADMYNLKISSMSFYPKYFKLYLNNSTEIRVSNDKSIKISLGDAAKVLEKLLIEGKKVQKVDLRYDKVIVSYE